MANKQFETWDIVRRSLARSKIKAPGKVATILLETFLEKSGKLRVSMCRAKELCKNPGEFYAWRQELKDKEWLEFSADSEGRIIRYMPGSKLEKYINKENIGCEIATTKMLFSVTDELHEKNDKLNDEVNHLRNEMKDFKVRVLEMIDIIDPPGTTEKVEMFLSKTYKLPIKPKKDDDPIIQ